MEGSGTGVGISPCFLRCALEWCSGKVGRRRHRKKEGDDLYSWFSAGTGCQSRNKATTRADEITTHSCAENGDAYAAAMTRRAISQLFETNNIRGVISRNRS